MAEPSLGWLRKSRSLWKARVRFRKARLAHWMRLRSKAYQRWHRLKERLPEGHPDRATAWAEYQRTDDLCDKWEGLLDEARMWLARRRREVKREEAERERERSQKASEHFWFDEFDCKDGTKVPKDAYPALRALARDFLEPMRSKFGRCGVTSGYRHRAYNARIGGASQSQHIYDDSPSSVAADVWFERGTPAQWAAEARRLAGKEGHGGVGQYSGAGFVHVDNGPRRDWWG